MGCSETGGVALTEGRPDGRYVGLQNCFRDEGFPFRNGEKEDAMQANLLPIGRMARINHVTVATLRLYDRMGLLKPAFIIGQWNGRKKD